MLIAINYVPKWVKAIAYIDAGTILKFLNKNIFILFDPPKAIISDEGTHFCNKLFDSMNK